MNESYRKQESHPKCLAWRWPTKQRWNHFYLPVTAGEPTIPPSEIAKWKAPLFHPCSAQRRRSRVKIHERPQTFLLFHRQTIQQIDKETRWNMPNHPNVDCFAHEQVPFEKSHSCAHDSYFPFDSKTLMRPYFSTLCCLLYHHAICKLAVHPPLFPSLLPITIHSFTAWG